MSTNIDVQQIKQRFGIIGSSPLMEHAIRVAAQVAPTDMSVLVTGERVLPTDNPLLQRPETS